MTVLKDLTASRECYQLLPEDNKRPVEGHELWVTMDGVADPVEHNHFFNRKLKAWVARFMDMSKADNAAAKDLMEYFKDRRERTRYDIYVGALTNLNLKLIRCLSML